ncbi:hypothetical protein WR25_11901 [Diploscapter pachys]|uniref:Uncharacterized protein n=1 Tax=Diploscapter pachys TaxID=2018661 RepID=A0A2A2K433_9BILA|nr:hypothetical protein WR25_11901 [Diploscapter pachys]
MTVAFTEEEGTITFPTGSVLAMRADSESLDLVLTVPEGEDTGRMREVVASHLDRFAFREAPLTFDWREGLATGVRPVVQLQVRVEHRLVRRVPTILRGLGVAGFAHAGLQCRVGDDAFDRIGIARNVLRIDEEAGDAVLHQIDRARRARGDDGNAGGHGFGGDVAEGFGDRGVEEDVHRRDRAAEVVARLEAREDRVRGLLREPVFRRALADDEHLVRHAAAGELFHHLGKDVEPLFLHQPAEETDRDLMIGDAEAAAPGAIAAVRLEAFVIDAARPDGDRRGDAPFAERLAHAGAGRHDAIDAVVEARHDRLDHRNSGAETWMMLGANASRSSRVALGR